MPMLLDSIAHYANHEYNRYANTRRVQYFDSLLQNAEGIAKTEWQFDKAIELLYSGKTEEAIAYLSELLTQIQSGKLDGEETEYYLSKLKTQINQKLALSYLRLGEQQNCVLNHSSASCILPISKDGHHQLEHGSTKAIELLEKLLQDHPNDLELLWLLNIAHMTLDQYPEQIPEKWRIPENKFTSAYHIPQFKDISDHLGLDVFGLSGGVIIEDFNNDHLLDIMLTSWGLHDQVRYFEAVVTSGSAKGHHTKATALLEYQEKTNEAGLAGITGGLNMMQTDYNNDGFMDVFILRGAWMEQYGAHPNSLLSNNGDGTFSDVTAEAGLLSFHPTQTATWQDFNNDGWLDVFIGNESAGNATDHPCELFINNKDGTFVNLANEAGVDLNGYVKAVTSGDYNNDNLPDLFISTLDKQNFLFENKGIENGLLKFKDVTEAAGLSADHYSFPAWFWDYNNDGWQDIFVSGYKRGSYRSAAFDIAAEYLNMPRKAEKARLYKNCGQSEDGQVVFKDVAEAVKLDRVIHAMGNNFGDLDNDGWPDMYFGTGYPELSDIIPNLMFRNAEGQDFQDVTFKGGFGHLQKGHGIAFADIDNDGDQDVYAVMGGAFEGDGFRNALFENPYRNDPHTNVSHNWLKIKLVGQQTNRMAAGVKVKIVVHGKQGKRSIYKTVNEDGSFGSSPSWIEAGLESAKSVNMLEVKWPVSGTVQTFSDIEVNQFIIVTEGIDSISNVETIHLNMPNKNHKHNHGNMTHKKLTSDIKIQ